MSNRCDYFFFDEDHPTYGHLCGNPATKAVEFLNDSLPVCEEHAQDAECGAASLLVSLQDTGYEN